MKKTRRTHKFAIVFLLLVSIVLVACGSDSEESSNSVTIGAESEPTCLDPVGDCAADAWGIWTVISQTLPRPFVAARVGDDDVWEYQITDLLTKEPELTTDPQTVTYTINPDAEWSDGTPVTYKDFQYTWDEIVNGENIYDPTGYVDIESIENKDGDDKVVVVTFSTVFAGWRQLFGGGYGLMPEHILAGKDRNAETKDGYDFSAGPFTFKEWKKGDSITLERNENYWGEKAELEEVVFKFMSDSTSQLSSFNNGEVSAIYPQPGPEVQEAFVANEFDDVNSIVNPVTSNLEALWLNNEAAPFDNLDVRKALIYGLDRDAVVEALFGDIGITEAVNSFLPSVLVEYSLPAFEKYTFNEAESTSLLEDAGWSKNSDGKWEKDGELLEFTISTTSGNDGRQLMMEVIQKQLQDQGWTITLDPQDDLFTSLTDGEYQAAIYAQVATSLDPGNCAIFCSFNIPTEENEFVGNNTMRVSSPEIDAALSAVDSELDVDARQQKSKDSESLLADDVVSIPLDPLPNVLLWSKEITGPDENPIEGPFSNLSKWKLA